MTTENPPDGYRDYEDHHLIASARELAYAAGCPLRDRYGFAASDESVLFIVRLLFAEDDDKKAGDAIGLANMNHEIQVAEGYDAPASEDYEQKIIAAVRPLIADRRAAAANSARIREEWEAETAGSLAAEAVALGYEAEVT